MSETDPRTAGPGRAEPGPADPAALREEAERLVAAGFAAVSMAASRVGAPTRERGGVAATGFDALGDALFGPSRHRRHSVANDSPECCLCPVCRAIAAARKPDPRLTERIGQGAGDVAAGAARVFRAFTAAGTAAESAAAGTAAGSAAAGSAAAEAAAGSAAGSATGGSAR